MGSHNHITRRWPRSTLTTTPLKTRCVHDGKNTAERPWQRQATPRPPTPPRAGPGTPHPQTSPHWTHQVISWGLKYLLGKYLAQLTDPTSQFKDAGLANFTLYLTNHEDVSGPHPADALGIPHKSCPASAVLISQEASHFNFVWSHLSVFNKWNPHFSSLQAEMITEHKRTDEAAAVL